MRSRLGSVGVALVIGAGIGLTLLLSERAPDAVGVGSAAPGFSLPREAGQTQLALGDLAGRVVLVNFWATWCKPCEDEMPAMERLYGRLRDQGFELVAISVDEDAADVTRFRERLGLSFPILLDPGRRVSNAYQAYRFPESFLIDRDGTIVSKYVGPREWDAPSYEESVRRLLAAGGAG